jgi:hypothetical protein
MNIKNLHQRTSLILGLSLLRPSATGQGFLRGGRALASPVGLSCPVVVWA